MSTLHVPRIDQLDAVAWNDELFSLLSVQIRRAFQYFPAAFLIRWSPVVEAAFKYGFYELPLRYTQSTFGQSLFGLEYRDSFSLSQASKYKLKLVSIFCVLPWLWEKSLKRILLRSREQLDATNKLENCIQLLNKFITLVNFCVFLQQAKYPTVSDRILGIRPMYPQQKGMRSVEYESVTRELLWHAFAEFLSFVLPLINVYKVKGFIQRLCKPMYNKKHVTISWNCGICGQLPVFPHEFGCQHVFCYYCIASSVTADANYLCIDCKHEAQGLSSVKPVARNLELLKR